MATRDIAAGDEILINYVQPFGQSAARRRVAFEEQHIWPLVPSPFPPEMDALTADPASPAYDSALREAGELEERLDEASTSWHVGALRADDALAQLRTLLEQARAVFGPAHLVQVRVRQLIVDVVEAAASKRPAPTDDILLLIQVR